MQGCNLILAEILDDSARLRKEPSVLWWVFSTFYVERNFIALRVVQSKIPHRQQWFQFILHSQRFPRVFFPFDQVCESSMCPFCLSPAAPSPGSQLCSLRNCHTCRAHSRANRLRAPRHQPVHWENWDGMNRESIWKPSVNSNSMFLNERRLGWSVLLSKLQLQ